MKILHILSQRPDSTGSGYYIQNIIRLAQRAGHRNYLLAALPSGENAQFGGLGSTTMDFVRFNGGDLDYAIPGMSDVMPYASSIFGELSEEQLTAYEDVFAQKIQNAAAVFEPDIIHSHHLWIATAAARRVLPELPVVTSCHSTDLRQFIQCSHLRDRVLADCQNIDRILALSLDQAEEVAALYKIGMDRIDIVGAGFDNELFSPSDESPPPPVQILYAGKLCYAKGVDVLLKSWMRLDRLPIHLHLAGSGSGEEEARCLELAAKLGTDITVHGRLPQQELARLMSRCHIFMLPSFFEGLPLVLLEALASGCRIITTDLPGCKELLGQASTDLVKFVELPALENRERVDRLFPEDLERIQADLADAVQSMVQSTLRNKSVNQGEIESLIDTYRWESVFSRIEKTYKRAMQEKSCGGERLQSLEQNPAVTG